MISVGLIGFGYWGPNLARNFAAVSRTRLSTVADLDAAHLASAQAAHPQAMVTSDAQEVINNPGIDLIAIATPVSSHYPLAKAALEAGKHLLMEKPLASTVDQARELVELAEAKGLMLAVDHTFLYTGAVLAIKEIISRDELGELLYFDSVRINLGLFQHDVDVIFDLAPHDLSILSHLVSEEPLWVQAMGSQIKNHPTKHQAYLHLSYQSGFMAHVHLSWLAPVKIRRTILAGSEKMIVYDDLESSEKVKIYDKGVLLTEKTDGNDFNPKVEYRSGDMLAPRISTKEALRTEVEHLADCLEQSATPLASGADGLKVMRILEASRKSLAQEGAKVEVSAS